MTTRTITQERLYELFGIANEMNNRQLAQFLNAVLMIDPGNFVVDVIVVNNGEDPVVVPLQYAHIFPGGVGVDLLTSAHADISEGLDEYLADDEAISLVKQFSVDELSIFLQALAPRLWVPLELDGIDTDIEVEEVIVGDDNDRIGLFLTCDGDMTPLQGGTSHKAEKGTVVNFSDYKKKSE